MKCADISQHWWSAADQCVKSYRLQAIGKHTRTQHVNNEFSVGQFTMRMSVILKILYVTHKFCIFSPPRARTRAHSLLYHPSYAYIPYWVYYYLLMLQTLAHFSSNIIRMCCVALLCVCVRLMRVRVMFFFLFLSFFHSCHSSFVCPNRMLYYIGHICWPAPIKSIRFFLLSILQITNHIYWVLCMRCV